MFCSYNIIYYFFKFLGGFMISLIKKCTLVLFSIMIVFAISNKAISDEPRNIPGITGVDNFPHSCVSCHKNYTDKKMDVRLSTILKEWNEKVDPKILAKVQSIAPEGVTLKGKHPFKVDADASIPEVCNKCHGKSMKTAFPLGNLLHTIHLSGGKDNTYITMFNGECTNCHKMDWKTGVWSIVNGKESDEDKK